MSNEWYDVDTNQWVDSLYYEWGFDAIETSSQLKQLCMDEDYVYVATTSGLSIIDIGTEQLTSFISMYNGCTSVWSDNSVVFIGSSEGVTSFQKYDTSVVMSYLRFPFINNNDVNHVHGNADIVMCCTSAGVNINRRSSNYTTYCNIQTANKCFVTFSNCYYYSVLNNNSINRLNSNNTNWTTADVVYNSSSWFLPDSVDIVDFFVTDNTSTAGYDNTLFIATSSGIYVYDEGSDDCYVFNSEQNNYFNTVTADNSTNINSGKMYVSTYGIGAALYVVDLYTKEVVDIYTIDRFGSTNDKLLQETIIGVSVTI